MDIWKSDETPRMSPIGHTSTWERLPSYANQMRHQGIAPSRTSELTYRVDFKKQHTINRSQFFRNCRGVAEAASRDNNSNDSRVRWNDNAIPTTASTTTPTAEMPSCEPVIETTFLNVNSRLIVKLPQTNVGFVSVLLVIRLFEEEKTNCSSWWRAVEADSTTDHLLGCDHTSRIGPNFSNKCA